MIRILFFVLMVFTSCYTEKLNAQSKEEQELIEKENKALETNYENLGVLISAAEFRIKASKSERRDFEEGYIPWVSIEKPEERIKDLIKPQEIIIPASNVKILVDYPIEKPVFFEVKSNDSKGFTREAFVMKVSEIYKNMYAEEESTAKTKTLPLEQRKMHNRNTTDGKYGIWGHDITDLDLSGIEVYQNPNKEIIVVLFIES